MTTLLWECLKLSGFHMKPKTILFFNKEVRFILLHAANLQLINGNFWWRFWWQLWDQATMIAAWWSPGTSKTNVSSNIAPAVAKHCPFGLLQEKAISPAAWLTQDVRFGELWRKQKIHVVEDSIKCERIEAGPMPCASSCKCLGY